MKSENDVLLKWKDFFKFFKKGLNPLRLGIVFFSSFIVTMGLAFLFIDSIALDLRIFCSIGIVCTSLFCLVNLLVVIDDMEHHKISMDEVYERHKRYLEKELQYYGLKDKLVKQESKDGNRSKREEASKGRTSKSDK